MTYKKILVPIHLGIGDSNDHWTLLVIDLVNKSFGYYDCYHRSLYNHEPSPDQLLIINVSISIDCIPFHLSFLIQVMKKWLNNQAQTSGVAKDFNCDDWKVTFMWQGAAIPKQVTSWDCGVFLCALAKCIYMNQGFHFTQADIPFLRHALCYEIISNTKLFGN